ncbi:MAG: DUF5301 domain-containing protein [Tissierellia bacterium]|nr:DUF5301 domain-containing protein [Tissierellia bacterium]
MDKKKKWLFLIPALVLVLTYFFVDKYFIHRQVQVPGVEDIRTISFVKVIHKRGVEKRTLHKKSHRIKVLHALQDSTKTKKYSTSNYPDKENFTLLLMELEDGTIHHSIYEEDNHFYYERPFEVIYKLNSDIYSLIDRLTEEDDIENISTDIDHLFE